MYDTLNANDALICNFHTVLDLDIVMVANVVVAAAPVGIVGIFA